MAIDGQWEVSVKTPMGTQTSLLSLHTEGGQLTGEQKNQFGVLPLEDGRVEGERLTWTLNMKQPFPMKLDADVKVVGDRMEGLVRAGMMGASSLTGTRKAPE